MKQELIERLGARDACIGVVGLGYIGLPLLEAFGRSGFRVVGLDVDAERVQMLARGHSYMRRVPSEWIQEALAKGLLSVTDDFRELGKLDAVLICVPTPLTRAREPDLTFVRDTAEAVSRSLRRGQLVVLESTTYPGTTEEIVQPILERGGLRAGSDFFLAYSPEREDPGNETFRTTNIPRLVGGVDPISTEVAVCLYQTAMDKVVAVSNAKVAEGGKILENIYRAVNIALVNELKVLFQRMDLDIWEVIDAAATKPFGFQRFLPGPGLGGHCIPIDPFYLAWKAREYGFDTRFIELAGEINTQMPCYVVDRTAEALNDRHKSVRGSRGMIIGVAYKPNTDDVRESPAIRVIELLEARGAKLGYYDPLVPELPRTASISVQASPCELSAETLAASDFVLIATDHDGIDWSFVVEHAPLVVDTRNATREVTQGREKIVKA